MTRPKGIILSLVILLSGLLPCAGPTAIAAESLPAGGVVAPADPNASQTPNDPPGNPAVTEVPPTTLVAHWKLDELSGTTAADSAGSHPGIVIGDGLWRPYDGRIDGAMEFDGIGDQIDCGHGSAFSIRDQITVAAWIRVNRFDRDFQAIITKGDSAFRLQRAQNTSALEFACSGVQVPGTSYGNIYGTIPVNDGQWHHAAGVYDGQTISLYIDGRLDVSSTATGRINQNSWPVLVGENAQIPMRYWNGWIDDVRIYSSALTESQIQSLSVAGRTWHVNRATGNDAFSGLSRQQAVGTIQPAINLAQDGDKVLVWPGVYSESIDFHGKAITVASATDAAIIESQGNAVDFHTGEGPSSVLRNMIVRNSQYGVIVSSNSRPTLKNLTIVGNLFGVRLDGSSMPTIANCIFWNNLNDDLVYEFDCQAQFSWLRDDLDPMPVAWWKFDEGYGPTAKDTLGNSNGSLNGPTWTTGIVGNALDFDGIDDSVWIPDNDFIRLGTGDFTLSAWICPRSLDLDEYTVLAKVEGLNNKEYMLQVHAQQPRLDVEKDSNDGRAVGAANCKVGQWQHIVVTFNSRTLKATFYYNGQEQLSPTFGPVITALPVCLNNDLLIGLRGGSYDRYGFNGKIDEVMLYNRVLTVAQVQTLYQKCMGPRFANPLAGDYHLLSQYGRFMPVSDPNLARGKDGIWILDDQTSPCIDGGDWTESVRLEPMPNGARIDMGAHGGTPYASRSRWPLEGDFNHDGLVDLRDFAVFTSEWLMTVPWAP
jgi:parallel beta-helix repeat protein